MRHSFDLFLASDGYLFCAGTFGRWTELNRGGFRFRASKRVTENTSDQW